MGTKVIVQADPEVKQDVDEISIPDLWHLAMTLPKDQQEMVLETWHLCHSLREHIRQNS